MATDDERSPEEKRRERTRAVLLGLILALGVVAMVQLGARRATAPDRDQRPAVSGTYRVVARCEGCGCEPTPSHPGSPPERVVVHPGQPLGFPVARVCEDGPSCAAQLARRAPSGVRGPVVLPPDADPALLRRELERGPPMRPLGESGGYAVQVERERRSESGCLRVVRSSELTPGAGGRWRWIERYASAGGDGACPELDAIGCTVAVERVLEPTSSSNEQ